ncbi:ribose-5-phosphate isomerase [Clostridium sp. WILCCON 0269]|uniref:Ribose-5-phosphate isomerase n=1 Tax=Candidatus Clostridium eludens TaxID=3381663 RepID=A0ABW8SJP9_9CLOT
MNKYFRDKEEVYSKIINMLCEYKGLSKQELIDILKDKSCRYLYFLLIKKYKCCDLELVQKDFPLLNENKIKNNVKKAEEKLLLNKHIREMYFEAEEIIDKAK